MSSYAFVFLDTVCLWIHRVRVGLPRSPAPKEEAVHVRQNVADNMQPKMPAPNLSALSEPLFLSTNTVDQEDTVSLRSSRHSWVR